MSLAILAVRKAYYIKAPLTPGKFSAVIRREISTVREMDSMSLASASIRLNVDYLVNA